MWTIDFKAGKLFVIIAVNIEDGDGVEEFGRWIHEWRRYGNDSTDIVWMTGGEQLHRSRSARKAGKESTLSVSVVAVLTTL